MFASAESPELHFLHGRRTPRTLNIQLLGEVFNAGREISVAIRLMTLLFYIQILGPAQQREESTVACLIQHIAIHLVN